MKKVLLTSCLVLLVHSLWSQNTEGAQIVPVSQAFQGVPNTNGDNYTFQVGVPYAVPENNNYDIRFPWDIKYLYGTFAEESVDFSKGYFGDKIRISWELRNNYDQISTLKIYRREYSETTNNPWVFVSNVSKDDTQYEDQYVEGGLLYEYKIFADGIDNTEILYTNFITGIGFRNPTAIVTGNVSYEGGNPVKDVIVLAESDGSSTNLGSSLNISENSFLNISQMSKTIENVATLQAWIKPESPYTDDSGLPIRVFRLKETINTSTFEFDVNLRLLATSNALEVAIDGATYIVQDYIPSGTVDSRGDDVLIDMSNVNTEFIHVSVVVEQNEVPILYINGREINTDYVNNMLNVLDEDGEILYPGFTATIPTATSDLSAVSEWTNVHIGGERSAYLDEIRIWNASLNCDVNDNNCDDIIRTDFRRYISGNDSRLISYLSANEGVGPFAYDASRNGFDYNKNNGRLVLNDTDPNPVLWELNASNIPTSSQLGVLGVTDSNGNYEITSIPYSGTGESFTITPTYPNHEFEPNQQLVFLGQGSEVVNQIDFIDKSSFIFKGKVLFDTRGVFPSIAEVPGGTSILEAGYNQYQIGNLTYDKGNYWFNDQDNDDPSDDKLDEYAQIFSQDVQIYIDGQLVLDENNQPVTTDSSGYFEISVPIGEHFIRVEKNGYEFEHNGRYPEGTGNLVEFFEDALNTVVFIDNTKVTTVGRVVGGAIEAQKPIGFGHQGTYAPAYVDDNGLDQNFEVSSNNNIGMANVTFGYAPPGSTITPETSFTFTTNIETGEYRVELLPLNYTINETNGVVIINNDDNINLLGSNETLNASVVGDPIIPEFSFPDGTIEQGIPYNYEKNFIYRSAPMLQVLKQESDEEVVLNEGQTDETIISTEGFQYPVFTQFLNYEIELKSFERYTNFDGTDEEEDLVPVIDGDLVVTNNLALSGSETIERNQNDQSIIYYRFIAGSPNVFTPFTKTINISYNIPAQSINTAAENLITEGIILGGQSDGEQAFVTTAPEIPDIILRDPPGSNSFASIQEGETFTFTKSNDFTSSGGFSQDIKVKLGVDFAFGGGAAGPFFELDNTIDIDTGISVSTESKTGDELTKTYSFSQTISTSSDPEFVGSEGDLYIGETENYYYGSYDNVQAADQEIGNPSDNLTLTNTVDGGSIHITTQKALSFVEEPGSTLFVYSQKYIIDNLIPDLEVIVQALDPSDPQREFYIQQINLWRLTILKNEHTKYRALYDRENLKAETLAIIDTYLSDIQDALDNAEGTTYAEENFNAATQLRALINSNFAENISFDSGVGEIVRTVETAVVNTQSTLYSVEIDESVGASLGFDVNGVGIESSTSGYATQNFNDELSEEETSTVAISYTLSDNDPANVLSVDIVNTFGGYGPIFSTIGGRTSCPYEGPELSNYYIHNEYSAYLQAVATFEANNPDDMHGPGRPEYTIPGLLGDDGEQLSYATQPAEDPQLSVVVAEVFNVPESNNAEFTLLLQNLADANSDAADFNYFELIVDNTTNPNNAIINLSQNGTVVYVPYGQTIEYVLTLGKSVSDVYDYEDIRVVLQSRCDPVNVFDDVLISAHFVPSCTEVEVSAPLENWVYNNNVAFNEDGSVNPLNIALTSYDQSFNNFKKLDLEYRLSGSPSWTRLSTYYNTQEFYDAADAAGETDIELIETPEVTFAFDIVGLQLQDGNYEIRGRTECTNGTEYISEVVQGTVDVNAPQRFGTPLPIDGILSSGEDLKVSFNENIFYNSALSTIEIRSETNQLPINNSVSLYFEGSNTATIQSPRIVTGDLSIEFWLNNATVASNATIISQQNGIELELINGEMQFTLGDIVAIGSIANDGLFHHYSITHDNDSGTLQIIQDNQVIAVGNGSTDIQFTNNNTLVIGGNNFTGNIHDLRLWSKTLTLSEAAANIYTKIIGNESNLLGFWPMNEGRGDIAHDLAFFKHADVSNVDWDIKPKGDSYEFINSQYLELDNVGLVQLNSRMDATISFWVKTANTQQSTIFSNGRGDGSDIIQSNGYANKWAIDMNNSGQLTFESEGISSLIIPQNVADNNWHHIALLINRNGSLISYLDGSQVASNPITDIGGFSGNKVWLGARGLTEINGDITIDNEFSGKIDEFRLWNSLRNVDQILRDQFNEIDFETTGLLLYSKFNEPEPSNGNGPIYYHADINQTVTPTNMIISSGVVNYSDDTPPIKPSRDLINLQVSYVINEDEMIIEPVISDWAALEGQIMDITVHRMFDSSNNMQESPITWTAFVQQNDVRWYVDGFSEAVDIVMNSGESESFDIIIVNTGGNTQPYDIGNIPSWLSLSNSSGTINPDSEVVITATIDSLLSVGEYEQSLHLETDFGFDQIIQLDIRVLGDIPDWDVDPNNFDYSMNIVGKISVDGVLSEDLYDSVGAFVDGEVRGSTNIIYDESYQEYFVFLTVYSNSASGDNISFKIWDASEGDVLQAALDTNLNIQFLENNVIGSLSNSSIFENSGFAEQTITLNEGWTWISTNVTDPNFSDLNVLTNGMELETSDRILSHAPSRLDTYYNDPSQPANSSWNGTISANGGLSNQYMYKVNFAHSQELILTGEPIDLNTWSFAIQENWNWLPYPLNQNVDINSVLSVFNATEGDVIKSQNLFAIYDTNNGWSGTLQYLEEGKGYMLKSSQEQSFQYPNIFGKTLSARGNDDFSHIGVAEEFKQYPENMNAVVLLPNGYDSLLVYDDEGVIKGSARNQIVGEKALSFITVYGKQQENLTFYIKNSEGVVATTKTFVFKSNNVLGTVANPIILEEDDTKFISDIKVYPNPFEKDLLFDVNIEKDQNVNIKMFNIIGQLVFEKDLKLNIGQHNVKVSPKLPLGVYSLRIYINGEMKTFRVIKN